MTPGTPEPAPPPPYGRAFWLALPAGGLLVAWGIAGLLRNAVSTVPASWLRWLLGVLLAHDLVLAPAVLAVGQLLRRAAETWRGPLRAALIVSGTLTLLSVPLLLGYGRDDQPGNRSLMPSNYPVNLAVVLAVVWALAAAWGLHRLRATRR